VPNAALWSKYFVVWRRELLKANIELSFQEYNVHISPFNNLNTNFLIIAAKNLLMYQMVDPHCDIQASTP